MDEDDVEVIVAENPLMMLMVVEDKSAPGGIKVEFRGSVSPYVVLGWLDGARAMVIRQLGEAN